ncbi:MAG: hypothetical protein ACP5QR_14925, partial [Rhizomicrobium sp.]
MTHQPTQRGIVFRTILEEIDARLWDTFKDLEHHEIDLTGSLPPPAGIVTALLARGSSREPGGREPLPMTNYTLLPTNCPGLKDSKIYLPRLCEKAKKPLAWDRDSDSTGEMIR